MPIQYQAIDTPGAMGPSKTITSAIWQKIVDDMALHQNALAVYYINGTGVALAAGDVVVLNDALDGSVLTTTVAGDPRMVAVVQDSVINIGQPGWFVIHGHVPALRVAGTIGRHVALQTSGTTKEAQEGVINSFGMTLTARTGAGLVEAIINNGSPMGGSFPVGDPSATHGPISFHLITATNLNLIPTPGAGLSLYVTRIRAQQNNTTPSLLTAKDTAGPTHVETYVMAGVQGFGIVDEFDPPWKVGENEGLDVQQSALGDLYGSVNFYVAAG